MIKWLIYIILLILLIILQISFFNTLPILTYLNWVFLFVIALTIFDKTRFIIIAMIAGYLLDIFSSATFGIHIFSIITVAFLSNYIYFNLLTNHRFFPVVLLISFNIILYHLLIAGVSSGLAFLKLSHGLGIKSLDFIEISFELMYTALAVSAGYALYFLMSKKIKKIFYHL